MWNLHYLTFKKCPFYQKNHLFFIVNKLEIIRRHKKSTTVTCRHVSKWLCDSHFQYFCLFLLKRFVICWGSMKLWGSLPIFWAVSWLPSCRGRNLAVGEEERPVPTWPRQQTQPSWRNRRSVWSSPGNYHCSQESSLDFSYRPVLSNNCVAVTMVISRSGSIRMFTSLEAA